MRLPQLDFLRGMAVILVLFRHHWVGIDALQHVGWVGVDLFFVLSGFLVSGLLFHEQKKYGDVKTGRFLIRRGFKIYPLFYFSLFLTAVIGLTFGWHDTLNWKGRLVQFASEILFLQSYIPPIWGPHWSLSVEEHFYLLLALTFPFIQTRVPKVAPFLFVFCLLLRIWHPDFFMSVLRMDSLFMGVMIAYYHHQGNLEGFYFRFRRFIVPLCFIPLLFIFDDPLQSYFTLTIGFSLLYVSFGALLMVFLYEKINTPKAVQWVGFYSYGIYLFHMYLIHYVVGTTYLFDAPHEFTRWTVPSFLVFAFGGIFLGALMSKLIEIPFLNFRDRYFPKRAAAV